MLESTTEYYYTDDNNQVVGPHTLEHIKQLRLQGQLFDDTQVCKTGETKWLPLADVLSVLANNKSKEQAKPLHKMTPPVTVKHKQEARGADKEEQHTRPTPNGAESKQGGDKIRIINTALLAVIAILLICQLIVGNLSIPTTEISTSTSKKSDSQSSRFVPVTIAEADYEYGAVHIDRENMAYAEEFHKEKGGKFGPIEIPTHHLHIGGYQGWQYVGILCNDGINGSWILVRRKKE